MYNIEKFEINKKGLHFNQKIVISGLKNFDRANSWLESARQATINTEAKGRFVTEISSQSWCFNVLTSEAAGDDIAICYFIKSVPD